MSPSKPPGPTFTVAVTVALIVGLGVLFALFGRPLAASIDRVAPLPAPPAAGESPGPEAPAPATAPTAPGSSPPAVVEPEPVRWSLTDLEVAVEDLALRAESLIEDGRTELEQLDDPRRSEGARREREMRRWGLWSRTWRNRLDDLEREMPTDDACAVHAPMRPACAALGDALDVLASVPEPIEVGGAIARLDDAAARLDALLRPPPPEDDDLGDDDQEDATSESAG